MVRAPSSPWSPSSIPKSRSYSITTTIVSMNSRATSSSSGSCEANRRGSSNSPTAIAAKPTGRMITSHVPSTRIPTARRCATAAHRGPVRSGRPRDKVRARRSLHVPLRLRSEPPTSAQSPYARPPVASVTLRARTLPACDSPEVSHLVDVSFDAGEHGRKRELFPRDLAAGRAEAHG